MVIRGDRGSYLNTYRKYSQLFDLFIRVSGRSEALGLVSQHKQ